jgi:fibronectin type 3 domain-containing protein
MRKALLSFILVFSFILYTTTAIAQEVPDNTSKMAAVMINVTTSVVGGTGEIKLSWLPEDNSTRYEVFRRDVGAATWGNIRATLEKEATEFVDDNVQTGKAYEYRIFRYYDAMGNYDSLQVLNFIGSGYVCAGIDVEPVEPNGRVLLIVDKTIYPAIESQIETLKEDLILEGWGVEIKEGERALRFDSLKVQLTKKQILESAAISSSQLKAVFLIGRIPVPYSGNLYPDGHGNHIGAWPSDSYYSSLTDFYWTDNIDFETNGRRDDQKNVKGDGKFDQSVIGKNVDLYVGRLDLYNMPAFAESEVDLIKQYLDRDHKYRTGELLLEKRGLIDESFNPKSYIETFGASAYRNFATLLGNENVVKADWFTTLKTDSYLWAYGCGGGTNTSASGIGKTQDYVDNDVNSVYTLTFGSYFGDWDSTNNFLRAPLCSKPASLISAWVARPPWYFHHMALGYPIGYSAQLSQNNSNEYYSVLLKKSTQTQYVLYAAGLNGVHAALLGDPTLGMYPNAVNMPSNLAMVNTEEAVKISWEAPPTDDPIWFNVYRSSKEDGPYDKINSEPLAGTTYDDADEIEGLYYYMVRSIQTVTNNSGSVQMLSRGIKSSIDIPVGVDEFAIEDMVEVYPNPAISDANIKITTNSPTDIRISIVDLEGNTIKNYDKYSLATGTHSFNWNLLDVNGTKVSNGIYIAKIVMNSRTIMSKIIVAQ